MWSPNAQCPNLRLTHPPKFLGPTASGCIRISENVEVGRTGQEICDLSAEKTPKMCFHLNSAVFYEIKSSRSRNFRRSSLFGSVML